MTTACDACGAGSATDERGAGYLAAFIVLFGMLTVGGVGVLVDSARIVSAERHASAAAYEAARAGAQAVERRLGPRAAAPTIDAAAARARRPGPPAGCWPARTPSCSSVDGDRPTRSW